MFDAALVDGAIALAPGRMTAPPTVGTGRSRSSRKVAGRCQSWVGRWPPRPGSVADPVDLIWLTGPRELIHFDIRQGESLHRLHDQHNQAQIRPTNSATVAVLETRFSSSVWPAASRRARISPRTGRRGALRWTAARRGPIGSLVVVLDLWDRVDPVWNVRAVLSAGQLGRPQSEAWRRILVPALTCLRPPALNQQPVCRRARNQLWQR